MLWLVWGRMAGSGEAAEPPQVSLRLLKPSRPPCRVSWGNWMATDRNFTYKELWVWCLSTMEHGFPCGSAGKESTHNEGDLGSIPGLGRSPGEGKGYSLQYSGLENSMGWTVHGVTKSPTRLSDFHFHFTMEQHQPWLLVALLFLKLLALGELRSSCSGEGSGYPLQYSCQGESHGQRRLAGYNPWGR